MMELALTVATFAVGIGAILLFRSVRTSRGRRLQKLTPGKKVIAVVLWVVFGLLAIPLYWSAQTDNPLLRRLVMAAALVVVAAYLSLRRRGSREEG